VTGLLVIMGSGETAPTMVKPHRSVFDRLGDRPAVLLDTPYGFQENADDISTRAVGYFAASVGRAVEVVGWRTDPPAGVVRERALARLREAGWIFAGPGSPTYALRQWRHTPIPDLLVDTLNDNGIVVFASAAALTLGSHTVPVYEIYKAGADPHWAPGMDLVASVTGMPAVVIPHYDNAEGGHHDTRYCYLGERRLSRLERELPDEAFVLGVDEHTAVLCDLSERTASVVGNGRLTVRRHGRSVVYPAGTVVDFASLVTGVPGQPPEGGTAADASPDATELVAQAAPGGTAGAPAPSLRSATDLAVGHFDAALAARDVDGCVGAVLELERARDDWAADTLTSDEGDHARAALHRMLLRLGDLAAVGAADPRDAVSPYVEALLELRRDARERGDFTASDWIRQRLRAAGVEVRDTPSGVEWDLRS
jgi:cyanophycinase-like exopeptidase